MARRITGGLLEVLELSPTAWYKGKDGIRAYYESPSQDTDGIFAVNGKKICRLVINLEEVYWHRPTSGLLRHIASYGINLDSGWTGSQEVQGEHINDAMKQSHFSAVRHRDGRISVQKTDEQRAIIFVNGRKHWTVPIALAHNALEELGVSTREGWYPVQHDFSNFASHEHRSRQLL